MIYIESATIFPCKVKLPVDYDSENICTLIIGLHGGGLTSESMIDLWDSIQDRNFIYITPQGPFPMITKDKIVYDWANWPSGEDELIEKSMKISEKYIINTIEQVKIKYNIGDVYLSGFSQGAIFTYLAGIKNSHLFKGLICMSGPGLLKPLNNPFGKKSSSDWVSENEIKNAPTLRIFITHGTNDKVAEIELAHKSAEILTGYNHDVTLSEFEGTHDFPPEHLLREINQWL